MGKEELFAMAQAMDTEEYCMLESDTSRVIVVPDRYKTFGVEEDTNVERVKFKFPKVVGDNVDLTTLDLRINFQNASGGLDKYVVDDVTETDDGYITFTWVIQDGVTLQSGQISFVVQAVKSTEDGTVEKKWSTTLNKIGQVLEGLEVDETIEQQNPDIIESILTRLDELEENGGGGSTPGKDGREIELQNSGTAIQWRYAGDNAWTDLVQLSELKGDPGDDGITPNIQIGTVQTLEPEQQATASVTGTTENPLLNLGIPKGEKGDPGEGSEAEPYELPIMSDTQLGGGKAKAKDNECVPVSSDKNGKLFIPMMGSSDEMITELLNMCLLSDQEKKMESKGMFGNSFSLMQLGEYSNYIDRDSFSSRGKIIKNNLQIVDKNGVPIELRGIGTHIILAYTNMHTIEMFKSLKCFGINCIRISVYLEDRYDSSPASGGNSKLWQGYINNKEEQDAEIEKIVNYCTELGMYVILDWHVMSGGNGGGVNDLHETEAIEFFQKYSLKYSTYGNVLYEFANEPFQTEYSDLAHYVNNVRNVVVENVDNPVMFCGVGKGGGVVETYNALNQLGINDVFVSLHSYGTNISTAFETYRKQGIPVCSTEYGIGSESGETTDAMAEMFVTNMEYMHENAVPSIVWKLTDQEKTSNWGVFKLRDDTPNNGYYSYGGIIDSVDLSDKGKVIFKNFRKYAFEEWIERGQEGVVNYNITYNLTGVSLTNNQTMIEENETYNSSISFLEGFNKLLQVIIKMGGIDITESSLEGMNINITNVMGELEIKIIASNDSSLPIYPLESGTAEFTDGTTLEVTNGNHIKLLRGTSYNGFLNIGKVSENSDNPTANTNAVNNRPEFARLYLGDNVKLNITNIKYDTTATAPSMFWAIGLREANGSTTVISTGNVTSHNNDDVLMDFEIEQDKGCGSIFLYSSDYLCKSFECDVEIIVNETKWV